MEIRGHQDVAVENLEMVGLAVAIQVNELRNLIATVHMDDAVDDLEPERFKKPGSNPLPFQSTPVTFQAADHPHIPIP